jgi:hypothetical protein
LKDCFGFELFRALQVEELCLEAHPILVIAHLASHLSLPTYQQLSLHGPEEIKFTGIYVKELAFFKVCTKKTMTKLTHPILNNNDDDNNNSQVANQSYSFCSSIIDIQDCSLHVL